MRWTACLMPLLLALGSLASRSAAQDVTEEIEAGGVYVPAEEEGPTEPPAARATPLVVELPPPRDPAAPVAPPIRYTLANGLRVVLQPVPDRRFSAVAVTYDVGSGDVPSGWTGLAHLTEHLMFSGTDVLDEVETYLRLEAAGAIERNGETSPDRSIYYEVLPTSQLDWALYIESQRMARMLAGLTEARVERQREVVLHEGWERGTYGWRGLLAGRLYGGVFPEGHPYAHAIVERAEDVRAIRLRHVRWFFQRHYGPDDATLAIVGGFDVERVRAAIERRFGPVRRSAPSAARPAPAPVRPLDHERRTTIQIQHDRDQLYVAWPTPALYAPGDAELDVLSTLLGERRDAPLRAALLESGLALEASVGQRSHRRGSLFAIHAVPAPGHTTAELLQVIDAVLARARAHAFDAAAVERARERWARDQRMEVEDLGHRAIRLGLANDDYAPTIEAEQRRYRAVDPGAVARVLRDWLPADRRLVLVAEADPNAAPGGQLRRDEQVRR